MKSGVDGGTRPYEMSQTARQWAQPWWLHAPIASGRDVGRPPRDARREFAVIAAQIGLAAWMFGTAMTSSCVTLDRFSGATPALTREAGARADAPAEGRPAVKPPHADR